MKIRNTSTRRARNNIWTPTGKAAGRGYRKHWTWDENESKRSKVSHNRENHKRILKDRDREIENLKQQIAAVSLTAETS